MTQSLILIDFINEFLHRDGKITPGWMWQFCETHGTLQNVKKLIDTFRREKKEIIWVRLGFHENYDNCSTLSPRFQWAPAMGILREWTWSVEFVEELDYQPNEKTITKTRISPFYKTGLEEYLREQWIDELIIAWVATDLAVSSIARDAHDRDFTPIVISDACATISDDHHAAALISIGKVAQVMKTDEFCLTL